MMGTVLFILAGITLVVMNRYSSFFLAENKAQVVPAAAAPTQFVYELYNPQTGVHSGRLTAAKYEVLPDGKTIDCRGVDLNVESTLGEVTLTCDRALVKVDKDSRSVSDLTLEGKVSATAAKADQVVASGRFEKVSYNARSRDINAEGAVELAYSQALLVQGTGLTGNTDSMHFTVERDVKVTIKASEGDANTRLPAGLASMPGELVATCAGPLTYDSSFSTISLADGVTVDGTGLHLTGKEVRIAFSGNPEGASGGADERWKPLSLDVAGPAEITAAAAKGEMKISGSRIEWQAAPGRAHVTGSPARISMGEDFVEAPELTATMNEAGVPLVMDASGQGKAFITAGGAHLKGLTASGESRTAAARVESSGAAAVAAAEPVSVSWGRLFHYDAAQGMVTLGGGVDAVQGKSSVKASKITASVSPSDGTILALNADGKITFVKGDREVTGDSAVYNAANDLLTLQGKPVTVTMPGGSFTSGLLSYSPGKRTLVAERGSERNCSLDLREGPTGDPGGAKAPLHLAAPRVKGDLSGAVSTFTCEGGVAVATGDTRVACDSVTLSGASNDLAGTAVDSSAEVSKSPVRIDGQGNVMFVRGSSDAKGSVFSATGDRFTFTQADGKVNLSAAPPSRVEMTYFNNAGDSDTATVWADSMDTTVGGDEVRCARPKVAISARGMLLGFPTESSTRKDSPSKSSEGRSKVYVESTGEMIMKRTSSDPKAGVDKGTLAFTGGVTGAARNESASTRDELTADTLVLDLEMANPGAAKGSVGAVTQKADVTAAQASGGVSLKHTGPGQIMNGKGDSFDWVKANNSGRLRGNPAVVWSEGKQTGTQSGGEFIYSFTEDKVTAVINRGGAGSITIRRKPKAK